MELIPAKNIISSYSAHAGWFGCAYNMNIYKGCSHGCIYCDSRSECYQIEDFGRVRAKADALNIIARNLRSKQRKGVIATGGMSDPYNPNEVKYELTRGALKLIDKYRFGIAPLTKSALITRDIGLYQRIMQHSPVSVMMTLTTSDDDLCRIVEPNVSVSSERFAALKVFADAGVHTGIAMMPLLPFLEDTKKNLAGIVEFADEAGVKYIYPSFSMTLRSGQREYYYAALDKHYPGLSDTYVKRYGGSYGCPVPDYHTLKPYFLKLCKQAGILTRMRDIVASIHKGYVKEQVSWL